MSVKRFARRVMSRFKEASLTLAAWRRARSIQPSHEGTRVSFYSKRYPDIPPTGDGMALGGEVKLTYLQSEFVHSPAEANILYVVSSVIRADVIRVATYHRKRGARIVVNQNGLYYPAWYGAGWSGRNEVFKNLLGLADHVVFQSAFCRYACKELLGVEPSQSCILHNPVDVKQFRPRESKDGMRAPMLMTLAPPLRQYYRIVSAIGALAIARRSLPDCRMIVAGVSRESSGWTELSDVIAQALSSCGLSPDCLDLRPQYGRAEAALLFQQADVFLHTACNDPCPNVVVEALASGLPVVFSATGGVPELVGEGEGVGILSECSWERFCPPAPEALAQGIVAVFSDLARFSSRARSRAERLFGIEGYLQAHRDLFSRIRGAAGHA